MDLYKYAAQNRLRFPSNKGDLVVEQLFAMPLTSKTGFDLDSVAQAIDAECTATGKSFVETAASNPRKSVLTIMLDIVKDVIATKQAENKAAADRKAKAELKDKIRDAMNRKKDEQISSASMEELQKQLDALGD